MLEAIIDGYVDPLLLPSLLLGLYLPLAHTHFILILLCQMSAPAARKLLATGYVAAPTPALTANTLRITPAILLGLILSFVMFIFLYVGFCGMMDMGVNDQVHGAILAGCRLCLCRLLLNCCCILFERFLKERVNAFYLIDRTTHATDSVLCLSGVQPFNILTHPRASVLGQGQG